jgi:hypothetical protein
MFHLAAAKLGSRAVRARCCQALVGAILLWLAYDLRPASAQALNEVVVLTGWSADAKMALASSLIYDPLPSQRELRVIRARISGIVAAEAARAATLHAQHGQPPLVDEGPGPVLAVQVHLARQQ